jgi:hypothetical protein
VVQDQERLLRTPGGRSVVLVRYHGAIGNDVRPQRRWRWELHAQDFTVRLDDGQDVRVDTQHIQILPHPPDPEPPPVNGRRPLYVQTTGGENAPTSWIYGEETIAPGDHVELAGVLDLEPHPSAAAGSDRQARLHPILRGTARQPVRVRHHFATLSPED